MMDAKDKAFDFASDLTKQLITLATAVIALTVTFANDIFSTGSPDISGWMIAAWISYLVSIVLGIWTLMALTGTLEPVKGRRKPSIRGTNVTLPSLFQILTFLGGTACTVVYAITAALA